LGYTSCIGSGRGHYSHDLGKAAMNKTEARIRVRDLIISNFFEGLVEGAGQVYKEAVAEADRQVDAAIDG